PPSARHEQHQIEAPLGHQVLGVLGHRGEIPRENGFVNYRRWGVGSPTWRKSLRCPHVPLYSLLLLDSCADPRLPTLLLLLLTNRVPSWTFECSQLRSSYS